MSLDAKTWLLEQGLDEATATELAPRFTPAALTSIEQGYLRQQDYSRQAGELQRAQQELETANQNLTTEMAEWATARANGEKETAAQRKAFERAQAQAAVLRARVETLATQAGVDPRTALEGLDVPVTAPTSPTAPTGLPDGFDPSKFVTNDALNRQYAQVTQLAVTLPGELFNLATEHQQLFGKPLDTRAISNEIISRASTPRNQKSLDPRVVWEEMHKVSDRRAEVDKKKFDDAIKAAEERGRLAAATEGAVPGQMSAPGTRSAVLQGRESALKRPQPGDRVMGAVTALRSGKYRGNQQPTT